MVGWGVATGAAVVVGLAAEVLWTAHRPLPSFPDLDASGTIGAALDGVPVVVAAIGDSTLTGPGLPAPQQIWLWQALERVGSARPIAVRSFAAGGSRLADAARRIDEALAVRPDVVVVAVGSNDALHGTPTTAIERQLDALLRRLLDGAPVVAVANVGDLGNIPRVPQPLRSLLPARSRTVRAVIEDVIGRHERAVLLDVTPADETLRDGSVFVADRFHPGPRGHAAWAEVALPGLRAAFALLPQVGVLAADRRR